MTRCVMYYSGINHVINKYACMHTHKVFNFFFIPNKSSAVAEIGDRARTKSAEKWGLLCPFPWPIPSGILIHPTVWPQYIRLQIGRQRSRSIGRNVTCNGRPKASGRLSRNRKLLHTWLGMIGVAVSGSKEATSDLAKLLPVDRQPLTV